MYTYIKVNWKNAPPNEGVIWYSELNEDRWEVRKVVIFRDGSYGRADKDTETAGIILGEKPMPTFGEIAAQGEFEPEEITAEQFEWVWQQALRSL